MGERFGTLLNCMDGRTQREISDYLLTSMGVRYLDTITTAGMVRHLAGEPTEQTAIILSDLEVSTSKHGSRKIAVAAHHDCAGNPLPDDVQESQIAAAEARLQKLHPDAGIHGLWVGENWTVKRIGVG